MIFLNNHIISTINSGRRGLNFLDLFKYVLIVHLLVVFRWICFNASGGSVILRLRLQFFVAYGARFFKLNIILVKINYVNFC